MNEKQVLLLIETSTSWGTDIIKGIADYAHTNENWIFHLEPRGKFEKLSIPIGWDGDGIIARVTYDELAHQLVNSNKPVIDVSWYSYGTEEISSCTADEELAGQMVANHFLERAFRNFAYCGSANRPGYTDNFGKAFTNAVAVSGFSCHSFSQEEDFDLTQNWHARIHQLGNWILTLPMPIAIVAFSDVVGRQIAEACRMNEICIPDQVALLGGEHDRLTCQISRPPLSSIDLSPQRIGWEAAVLLSRMMNDKEPLKRSIKIPPAWIIVRQSTDTLAIDDPVLVKALKFIDKNASRAFTVAEVFDSVPTSRRVLEQRFQKFLGRTPAAEIRRVRVEKAKRLLADSDLSMKSIAAECGFEYPEVLTRVFRRQEGITPTTFRKQAQETE